MCIYIYIHVCVCTMDPLSYNMASPMAHIDLTAWSPIWAMGLNVGMLSPMSKDLIEHFELSMSFRECSK